MEPIELKLDVDTLLKHAKKAVANNKLFLAVENLNEALDFCSTNQEKHKVYLAFGDLFLAVENLPLARYAVYMAAKTQYKGGYYSMDLYRFIPELAEPYPEEEEEPADPMNSACFLEYNTVSNLIAQRKYSDAIKIFFCLPSDRRSMSFIVDDLALALEKDEKFNLDEHLLSLLPVIGEYASKDASFIELLLNGGDSTKSIAVEGAKYFIEDNEDVAVLRDVGEVYYLAGEFATAKMFFEKLLSLCEIDEISLYYMYVISLILGEREEASKYRSKYYTVCRFAMPPMTLLDICAVSTDAQNVEPYLVFIEKKQQAFYNSIMKKKNDPIDTELFIRIKSFCCLADTSLGCNVLETFSNTKDKEIFHRLCIVLLESPFAKSDLKRRILSLLSDVGYDGKVYCCLPEKAFICDFAKFRHRYGVWNKIYKEATDVILNADAYLPYYSDLLASVVKKFHEIIPSFEDGYEFMLFLVVYNYIRRLKENVSIESVSAYFKFSSQELEEFLSRNQLESLLI